MLSWWGLLALHPEGIWRKGEGEFRLRDLGSPSEAGRAESQSCRMRMDKSKKRMKVPHIGKTKDRDGGRGDPGRQAENGSRDWPGWRRGETAGLNERRAI